MAQENPEEAIQWVMDMPQGKTRTDTIRNMSWQLTEQNPEQAIALANTLNSRQERQSMLGQIASSWANQDLDAARAWAESLPDDETRTQVIGQLAGHWAQQDPTSAMAYAAGLEDTQSQAKAVRSMMHSLISQDPKGALAWVDQDVDASVRSQVMPELLSQWARQSPLEAAEYVAEMGSGDLQNQAAVQVARQWSEYEPSMRSNGHRASTMRIPDNRPIRGSFNAGLVKIWSQPEPGSCSSHKIANAINWWKRLSIPSGIKILKWESSGLPGCPVKNNVIKWSNNMPGNGWTKIAKRPWPGWKRIPSHPKLCIGCSTPDNLSRQNLSILRSRRSSQCGGFYHDNGS